MKRVFEEIRIIDLDVNKTRPSDVASGLRHMHLKLSHSPPPEWGQIFQQERQFPRHSMWRRAWVEGAYIVVDCPPEEIKRFHLTDLKEDVRSTNQKYLQWFEQQKAAEIRQSQAEQAEKDSLESLRKRLKFD